MEAAVREHDPRLTQLGIGPQLGSCPEDPRKRIDRVLFEQLARTRDPRARDALVERFMPLARSLARRYESSGEPLEDLVQVASLALVKAIDRYEPARGCAFMSFAVPTIMGELKRHFRDRTWSVRPPRELQELTLRVDHAVTRLAQEHDRAPTVPQVAAALGIDTELALEAMQARGGRAALSLQAPGTGPEAEPALEEVLGYDDGGFDGVESRAVLDRLCVGLPPRSREVLRLRFEQDMTQADIGALLGISQMQISRIIRQTIEHLRHVADRHAQRAAPGFARGTRAGNPAP